MEIEQVEVSKLLGVPLDCKLSWSKHIDTTVATFLSALSTRQLLQPQSGGEIDFTTTGIYERY
jgi:hypothetical protein